MKLSVIIPTCNRNDLLAKCLELLSPKNQTIKELYEVIVTDDSKDNISKALIEENYSWAKWVEGSKRGPAANRNNGAKSASGEWLIFIDDDCLPDKTLVETYSSAIKKDNGSLAFEGSIIPDNWYLMRKEMAECPINTDGNCFWSANICINSKLFCSIGGFDERFLIAAQEDQDIFLRLKNYTNIRFLKNCIVVHPVRYGSVIKKLDGIKIQFENWIYYTQKHSDKSIKSHLLLSVFDYIKIAVKNIIRFRFRYFFISIVKSGYSLYLFTTYKTK